MDRIISRGYRPGNREHANTQCCVVPVIRDGSLWITDRSRVFVIEEVTTDALTGLALKPGDVVGLWFGKKDDDTERYSEMTYPDKLAVVTGGGDIGLAELSEDHLTEVTERDDIDG